MRSARRSSRASAAAAAADGSSRAVFLVWIDLLASRKDRGAPVLKIVFWGSRGSGCVRRGPHVIKVRTRRRDASFSAVSLHGGNNVAKVNRKCHISGPDIPSESGWYMSEPF